MGKKNDIAGSIVGLVALLATVGFLLIGFTVGAWHIAWLLFLLIPVVSIIMDIATKKRDVKGLVTGFVAILCVAGFLLMGFVWNLWHPGWIIFFAIPISGIIANMFTAGEEKPQQNGQDTPQ